MKKSLLIILIISGFLNPLFSLKTLAQDQGYFSLLRIISLRISPNHDQATIYWSTNYPTSGRIEYGLTNGFGNWLEDNRQDTYHETVIGNLLSENTYYFRLRATAVDNSSVLSDIYQFETSTENDHQAPTVSDIHTSFVTGNTATFVWETNENANTCVHYGTVYGNLNKKSCNNSQVKIHDLTVKNLNRKTLYYYQVSSKDRFANEQFSVTYNFQTNADNDENISELIIYQITPFNRRAANGLNQINITLLTNRPVEGYVRYGEKSNNYPKRIYLDLPRDTSSEIILTDLKDDQVYFYKLYLKDVLNKNLETPEFSFTTWPANVLTQNGQIDLPTEDIFNINDLTQDFDQDGLINSQEQQYGTDPVRADSDGDGYIDGVEVLHGFNPLGPGKLGEQPVFGLPQAFAYGQPRLKSLAQEQNLALDLKNKLTQHFNQKIPQGTQDWHTLVNAYIYGGYPVQAIVQAIKFSGKTVHPTINWSAWQKSDDYKNYINH